MKIFQSGYLFGLRSYALMGALSNKEIILIGRLRKNIKTIPIKVPFIYRLGTLIKKKEKKSF